MFLSTSKLRLLLSTLLFAAATVAAAPAEQPTLPDWINCEDDPEWGRFRRMVAQELGAHEMVPTPALVEAAQEIFERKVTGKSTMPDEQFYMGYAPVMQDFFQGCNQQKITIPSCLYGVVTAMWILSFAQLQSSQIEEAERTLQHAKFLLGGHTRYCLDFMDASHWTVSSVDILAQNTQAGFRPPLSLPPVVIPPSPIRLDGIFTLTDYRVLVSAGQQELLPGKNMNYVEKEDHRAAGSESSLRVWEIGVHASLTAEPLNLWAGLVTGRFHFATLIEDQYPPWLPEKWSSLYAQNFGGGTLVDRSPTVRALQALFRARVPRSATSKDPVEDLDLLISEFREIIANSDDPLPDIFLCSVFVFCTLPEHRDAEVVERRGLLLPGLIGFFGHPLLFMVSPAQREHVFHNFLTLWSSPKTVLTVSDPFLQMQYEYQTGKILPHIRQHASYLSTDTTWPGNPRLLRRPNDILVVDRPHECVLMGVIQYHIDRWNGGKEFQQLQVLEGGGNKNNDSRDHPSQEDSRTTSRRGGSQGSSWSNQGEQEDNYAGKKLAAEGRLRIARHGLGQQLGHEVGEYLASIEQEEQKGSRSLEMCGENHNHVRDIHHSSAPDDDADFGYQNSVDHDGDDTDSYLEHLKRRAWERSRNSRGGGATASGMNSITNNNYEQCKRMNIAGSKRTGTKKGAASSFRGAGNDMAYPFQFVTRQLTKTRSFSEFTEFRAVILFPYDNDLITFYEFYQLSMPLWMPQHLSKYMFSQDHLDYDVRIGDVLAQHLQEGPDSNSYYYPFFGKEYAHERDPTSGKYTARRKQLWQTDTGFSPFQEDSVDAVFEILKFTDYFRYPGVQYFVSIGELLYLLQSKAYSEERLQAISREMRRFNVKSLTQTVARWEKALRHALGEDKFEKWKQVEY
ncbi:unnamed protein product [Amoebophrya sp. A25]|nr:unnamed protein product [Amoebophrya sp. A25]|eukprot:GSA25T00020328001.1